jgi:hypothetical protein
LMIDLAIRAYESENRTLPLRLSDLSPRYLAALPVDSFSGTNFVYHAHNDQFQLYSIGPDGKDDGGQPLAQVAGSDIPRGDLFVDSKY